MPPIVRVRVQDTLARERVRVDAFRTVVWPTTLFTLSTDAAMLLQDIRTEEYGSEYLMPEPSRPYQSQRCSRVINTSARAVLPVRFSLKCCLLALR
jgi:hypothetical protein